MSKGKLALGLLGGIAAGALLGILFAPEEGKKTRNKITKKGNEFSGQVKGKIEDLVKNLKNHQNELIKEGKNLATNKK